MLINQSELESLNIIIRIILSVRNNLWCILVGKFAKTVLNIEDASSIKLFITNISEVAVEEFTVERGWKGVVEGAGYKSLSHNTTGLINPQWPTSVRTTFALISHLAGRTHDTTMSRTYTYTYSSILMVRLLMRHSCRGCRVAATLPGCWPRGDTSVGDTTHRECRRHHGHCTVTE